MSELTDVMEREIESLRADLDKFKSGYESAAEVAFELNEQLAASQAYAQQLREALEAMVSYATEQGKGLRMADEALALSSEGDTALKQWGARMLREIAAEYDSEPEREMFSGTVAQELIDRAAELDPSNEVMKGRT